MNGWWKAYREVAVEGLAVALLLAGAAFMLLGHWQVAAGCFLWGWLIDPTKKRPRLRANQAIVTAPDVRTSDLCAWEDIAVVRVLSEGVPPVNAATARTLHQTRCRDPYCPSCETAAESRNDTTHDPYDDNGARADSYERYFDGPVGI